MGPGLITQLYITFYIIHLINLSLYQYSIEWRKRMGSEYFHIFFFEIQYDLK